MSLIKIEHADFNLFVDCQNWEKVWGEALGNMSNDAEKLKCPYSWSGQAEVFIGEEKLTESGVESQAVFFDNKDYPIWVDFKDSLKIYDAYFNSSHRKVVKNFTYRGEKQVLSGFLNYDNDIGKSDIAIDYILKDGEHRSFLFSYEVLSRKLDYHEHWKTIIEDIETEYRMLSLDFLKKTYHSFTPGQTDENTHDLIWWQIFKPLCEEFIAAADAILRRPRHRLKGEEMFLRADKIRRFTPQLENEFFENQTNPAHLYRTEVNINNHNTQENQFFKYALNVIAKKHKRLGNMICSFPNLSDINKNDIEDKIKVFDALCENPFFRTISAWKGTLHNSLVIYRDVHYADILRTWAILQESYALNEGLYSLETKDIATLYEIWCYIQMKYIVSFKLKERGDVEVVDFDRTEMNPLFTCTKKKGEKSRILYKQGDVELAELYYNEEKEDDRNKPFTEKDLKMGAIQSMTVPQKPDIMLQLTKNLKEDGFKLTYLFDAKYRIAGKNEDGVDYPHSDAIDQMHRYRDSIYYREHKDGSLKKEIVGGYILFPGSGEPTKVEVSNFYKSIEAVNIGAFPLRPKDKETRKLLEDFVGKLIDRNASETLEECIPQKGLYYTENFGGERDLVLVVRVKDEEQYQWCLDNNIYNIPLEKVLQPADLMLADYLLILEPGHTKAKGLLKINRSKYNVLTKEQMASQGYPRKPTHNAYFVISTTSKSELAKLYKETEFRLLEVPSFKGISSYAYYFVKLGNLLKQTEDTEPSLDLR